MTTLRVWVHPPDFGTALGELTASFDRGWQEQLNDTGTGQVSVMNDDSGLALVDHGRILRFDLDDDPAFAVLVEPTTRHAVAAGEDADQFTQVTGRGTLAIWERMVVFPETPLAWQPAQDDRYFNYATVALDDSGWAGVVVTPDDDTDGGAPNVYAGNGALTDVGAKWIWDRDNSGAYDPAHPTATPLSPAGDVYFRKHFTTTADMAVEIKALCDDHCDVWLDGVYMVSSPTPVYTGEPATFQVFVSAGDHVLAVKGTNANALKAGLRVSVCEKLPDGTDGDVVVHTDDTWLCLGYPSDPPGFTPGQIVRILKEEAEARGVFSDCALTLGFTDTDDSTGTNPWSEREIAFTVGLDGLGVLRQLAETDMDLAMAPDTNRLDAWERTAGGRGQTRSVTLTAGTNLSELIHETS